MTVEPKKHTRFSSLFPLLVGRWYCPRRMFVGFTRISPHDPQLYESRGKTRTRPFRGESWLLFFVHIFWACGWTTSTLSPEKFEGSHRCRDTVLIA